MKAFVHHVAAIHKKATFYILSTSLASYLNNTGAIIKSNLNQRLSQSKIVSIKSTLGIDKNFSSESFEREFCPNDKNNNNNNKSLKQANLAQIEVRIVKASVSNSKRQGGGKLDTGIYLQKNYQEKNQFKRPG